MAYDLVSLMYEFEANGIFDIALPFLLIFAIVFGILTATNIFSGNKGVNVIVAVVIGLMSLRLGMVQAFFTEVFPRFGIAIAILLVIGILAAAFIPDEQRKYWSIGLAAAGALFGAIAVFNAFDAVDWFWTDWFFGENLSTTIIVLAIVGLIIAVSISNSPKSTDKDAGKANFSMWRPVKS